MIESFSGSVGLRDTGFSIRSSLCLFLTFTGLIGAFPGLFVFGGLCLFRGSLEIISR